MIVKNCTNGACFETKQTGYMSDHINLCDLNMELCTTIIDTPSFQECGFAVCSKKHSLDESCSLTLSKFHQQQQKNSKNMTNISAKFIEKFSELNLENSDDVMPAVKEVKKTVPETIAVDSAKNCNDQKTLISDSKCAVKDSCEQLPVAKISLKENKKEPLCLNCSKGIACCKKPELNQKENVNMKNLNLSLNQSLISRSPDRNGRRYCKAGLSTNPAKEYNKSTTRQQKYVTSLSDAPSNHQLLHGSGGTFSETFVHTTRNETNTLCNIDQKYFMEELLTPPGSYADSVCDQFSPSSQDYMSPSSINDIESYSRDIGISLSSIQELYPTPPHSAFECNRGGLSPTNDVSLYTNDYVSDSSASQFNKDDDSLLKFPSLEEVLTATEMSLSPLSDKTSELDVLSPSSLIEDEEIKQISLYLKNGDVPVNPIISQLITDCSESFSKYSDANSSRYSASASDQGIQKWCNVQQPLSYTQHINQSPVSANLSSNTIPQASTCISVPAYDASYTQNQLQNNENNVTSSTVFLMPVQLQTITISGQKDIKYQRELKTNNLKNRLVLPKSDEREQVKQVDCSKSQTLKETSKTTSVYPGGYKSVKAKISSNISREQKNQLFKLALEEQPTLKNETKLHSAVLAGDEKLVYVIIESTRTMNSKTKTSNPRISVKEKIQKFVNVQNSDGYTPLYYAAQGNNNLLTAYLLECGADPYIKEYKDGNTPFHIATAKGEEAVVLMELLYFRRDNSNVQNNKGQTVLMAAITNHGKIYNGVQRNGIKLIKYLLSENHKLSLQDNEGRTALHTAVLKKDVELLEVLLPFASDNVKLVKDKEGNTILHVAAMLTSIETEKHCRLIAMIITHCSKLTEIKNNKGEFPYQLVNENKKQEKELLKSKLDEHGFRNL